MANRLAAKADFLKRALYAGLRSINERPDSVAHKVYRPLLLGSRRVIVLVTRRPVAWIAQLQTVRWLDDRHLEVTGFAFERGIGFPDGPESIRVWLQGPSKLRIEADVEPRRDPAANARTKDSDYDYANTGFRAVFDLDGLYARPGARLRAFVSVTGAGHTRSGGFEKRFNGGSARFPGSRLRAGVQAIPDWDAEQGLLVEARVPAATAVSVGFAGRRVRLVVAGDRIAGGELVNAGTTIELQATPWAMAGSS